jgi:hypothetical protein
MSLAFCGRCGASIGKAHSYHKQDGSVVCHDCQHRENVERIASRRAIKPVATIVFAALVIAVGAGYAFWRYSTEGAPAANAADTGVATDTPSLRVAERAKALLAEQPALERADAIQRAIDQLKQSGAIPAEFEDGLLKMAAEEVLRRSE